MATCRDEELAVLGDEWPVDITAIRKGETIPADLLVPFLDADFGTQAYQLRLASFAATLESALWAISKRYVVRCRQGTIVVLDDTEAAIYTRDRFGAHYRGLHRSNRRARAVDATKLGADNRQRHERSLVVQGAVLLAATNARRDVEPTVYRRANPGVLAGADPAK